MRPRRARLGCAISPPLAGSDRPEPSAHRRETLRQTCQRTGKRTGKPGTIAAFVRPPQHDLMSAKLAVRVPFVGNLAGRTRHVDAAAQLIKILGDPADCVRMPLSVRAWLKSPRVEQWDGGIEYAWTDDFGCPDLANPGRIAPHRIEIVVRDKVPKTLPDKGRRRSDGGRIQAFEPFERCHFVLREVFPPRSARDQRLKQPRGRWRPFSAAVIAAVVEADGDKKGGHGFRPQASASFLSSSPIL